MSSFKDLKTWLGLFFWNRGGILLVLFLVCAIIAMLLLISLFDQEFLSLPFVVGLWAKIIVIIICFFGCASFVLGVQYANRGTNWRVAHQEAWRFAKEHDLMHDPIFLYAIKYTKKTGDPTELNEQIENFKKLQNTRKKLRQLKKDREELPQRIDDTLSEIKALETGLFG